MYTNLNTLAILPIHRCDVTCQQTRHSVPIISCCFIITIIFRFIPCPYLKFVHRHLLHGLHRAGNIKHGHLAISECFFVHMGFKISLKISSECDCLGSLNSAGKLFQSCGAAYVYAKRLSLYVMVFTDGIPRLLHVDDLGFHAVLYCSFILLVRITFSFKTFIPKCPIGCNLSLGKTNKS